MAWIPDNYILGLDRILNWVQDRGCTIWTIYDSDKPIEDSSKGRKIIGTNSGKGDDLETGIRRLKTFLSDYLDSGLVGYLWVKNSEGDKKGGFYTNFKILSQQPQNNQSSGSGFLAGIGSVEELTTKIRNDIERDLEFKRLQEENSRLKKENEDLKPGVIERVIGRVWETIEPFAPVMAKQIMQPGNNAIMGNTTEEKREEISGSGEEEKAHKLEEALKRLYAKDPEIHLKLEKLAELQEKNPALYEQAVKILNSM